MSKKLSEMSLEELWQLFPIFLTAHQPCWKDWYAQEEAFLMSLLPQDARVSHVGSTAIHTIWAKPIIDILVEVPPTCDLLHMKGIFTQSGYICMSQSTDRISFNKGYTENGFAEKVFHLHLRYFGDNDELYFRDYLNEYPDVASRYEAVKLKLWKEHEHNRDAYTAAKTDFVRTYTDAAKSVYGNRYPGNVN